LAFKGASPYSGPGATFRMEEDARKYKTDKAAQKRMDALLIADKALTNTTISEAARFQAGRTNQTYNRYAESLKADDVPARIKKWIKEGLLPASANLKAGVTWQQELNKAEKKALKSIPATHNYYFDPDKQFEHEQSMHQENEPEEAENNTVIVIDPNGKKFETTEENAKHLPKGWKRG
jgi:membrane-associated HD superfamily phosphohydrolase